MHFEGSSWAPWRAMEEHGYSVMRVLGASGCTSRVYEVKDPLGQWLFKRFSCGLHGFSCHLYLLFIILHHFEPKSSTIGAPAHGSGSFELLRLRVVKQLPWLGESDRENALREVRLLSSMKHPCRLDVKHHVFHVVDSVNSL